MLELTNQRFGKLVALRRLDEKKGQLFLWECQCDCGNICKVPGSYLKSGNTTSCGCGKYDGLKKYNLQNSEEAKIENGTQFGKLTVIEDLGFKPQYTGSTRNRRWYKCLCECGNITEASSNMLKEGTKTSCGCQISKGENIIKHILDKHSIIYNQEVVLQELLAECGQRLRFDFVIYDETGNIQRIIEFDGRQHFYGPDTNYWGHTTDTLETIQQRDKIKDDFCQRHNYTLIRIPYTAIDQITFEDIFSDKYIIRR